MAMAVLCWTATVAGAVAQTAGESVDLWVEVLDPRGRPPSDLDVTDFELFEGARNPPITALERGAAVRGNGRVVLYFDRSLAGSRTIKRAAEGLAGATHQLAALGDVELVIADEAPEVALRGRDELILAERLSRSALTDTGRLDVLEIRRRTLAALQPPPSAPPLTPEEVAEVVSAGVSEEIELVRERWQQLVAWVFQSDDEPPVAGPRVLFLMIDGFDLDPVEFYARFVDEEAVRGVARAARLPTLDGDVRELSRTLAAAGWTVYPVSFVEVAADEAGLEYTSIEGAGDTGPSATGGGTTSAPGFTLRPGSLFRRRQEPAAAAAGEEVRFREPLASLGRVADATGGEVVRSETALRDVLERFAGRVRLSYRSELELTGASEPLELRPRAAGWRTRVRGWHARGIPQEVAGIRLRRLLSGFEADGGFDVAAVLRLDGPPAADEEAEDDGPPAEETSVAGRLEARLNLRELAEAQGGEAVALEAGTFRVSVAISRAEGEPELRSEVVHEPDLGQLEEWTWRSDLELPPGATEVAVLVEDLERGGWGGRRAAVVHGDWAVGDLLPAPTVIEILRPDKEVLRGRVKFETEVYDSRVAAVDFLLDDREVARATRPPFDARIDVGRTPRRRQLTVVALDRTGAELGRDSAVLNGGSAGLAVDIVRPENLRATGSVTVAAEIAVPLERRLERVLFFWNNEPVATLYGPPFEQRIDIPAERPAGYVRVVAMLDDGLTAEDVIFLNGPATTDTVEVNLVELYVVVTDDEGRPVQGLGIGDFRVREEGVPQQIATFSDASDLPLTLGMAIDSSASMFVKLPGIQKAAIDFLHSTFSEQDRAFLVDFDSEPRLVRGTTRNLDRLERSISRLEASGRTALWESIVFSLVQLQEVRGRKALIVFSDGADEDDQFPFGSSLDVAKKMGVPIYLILMKKEPKASSGLSLFSRSFTSRVNRLVEATGGRVFYAKEYQDLGEVYDEIERELRSQYLLAYYPNEPRKSRAWRDVDVDVARKGLKPRTLSGYWP